MRKSKEFFGIMLSILVCVFLVGLWVYATTTVGDNVSVGGTLSVTSGTSLSEDLTIGGEDMSFLLGGVASISSTLWVGGAITTTDLFTGTVASLSQDLTIGSDDISFLQGGAASISSTLWVGGAITTTDLFTGTAASISGDLSVTASASFTDSILIGSITIRANNTSPSGTGNYGDIHINTGTGSVSFYDSNDDWSLINGN